MKSVHIVLSWALKWRVRSYNRAISRYFSKKERGIWSPSDSPDPFLLVFLFFTDASGERLRTISNSRLGPACPWPVSRGGYSLCTEGGWVLQQLAGVWFVFTGESPVRGLSGDQGASEREDFGSGALPGAVLPRRQIQHPDFAVGSFQLVRQALIR